MGDLTVAEELFSRLGSDDVLEGWSRLVRRERSSRILLGRHSARHGAAYLEAAAACADRAARGRALRLAGRREEAGALLRAAARAGSPDAEAWLWELEFCAGLDAGRPYYRGIERAAAAQPKRALWRALWAFGLFLDSERPGDGRGPAFNGALARAEEALALDAAQPTALIVRALCLRRAGQPRECLAAVGKALEARPAEAYLHFLQGLARLDLGDWDGFTAALERAIYLDEGTGNFEKAFKTDSGAWPQKRKVQAATELLRSMPKAHWLLVFRADCRRSPEVNDYLGSLKDLESAVDLAPDCGYAWSYLARARLSHGTVEGARQAADRSVELAPECGWIRAWRGEIRRRLGDTAGALEDLEIGARLDGDYEFAHAWRGGALRALGRLDEARAALELAAGLDPDYAWAHYELALTLRGQGRVDLALGRVEAASRLDPKFGWTRSAKPHDQREAVRELRGYLRRSRRDARGWAWLGECFLRQGRWRQAERALDRALALSPRHAWALAWRGRARAKLQKGRSAQADLSRSLRLDPGYANAWAWRGRLRLDQGRPSAAKRDLDRAYALDAKCAWILLWRGEAEAALGRLDDALESCGLALGLERGYAEAMARRALIFLERGQPAAARRELEAARALDPGARGAALAAARLACEDGLLHRARAAFRQALNEGSAGGFSARARAFLARRGPRPDASKALAAARGLLEQGEHAEAAAILSELLAWSPHDAQALRLRAQAWRNVAAYGKMAADLARAGRLEPGSPGQLELAKARWMEGRLEAAAAAARRARSLDPSPSTASESLVLESEALRGRGRFDEAIAAASQAAELSAAAAWPLVVRAKALRQSGLAQAALADVEAALALEPANPKAWAWLGEILRALGRRDQALSALEKAVALDARCAWALALRGEVKRELGDAAGAWADVQAAVRIDWRCCCDFDILSLEPPSVRRDPANAWIYAWRGGAARAREAWEPAQADLEHAAALDAACVWARAWLGELRLARGRPAEALPQLDAALALFPGHVDAWVWKGRALVELGRAAPARDAFARALELDADCVYAWLGSAVCLERLARPEEARRALERVRALAPQLLEGPA